MAPGNPQKDRAAGKTAEANVAQPAADAQTPSPVTAELLPRQGGVGALHIFLNEPRPDQGDHLASQPLMGISLNGRSSRIYKAALVSAEGAILATYALKVQRTDLQPSAVALRGAQESWQKDDAAWRERSRLRCECSAAGEVTPITAALSEFKADDGIGRLGPRFFCKHRKLFFHPRSPESFELLHDCHDQQLLTRIGLPTPSAGRERFLCGKEDTGSPNFRLFTETPPTGAGAKGVGTEEECILAQGRVAHARAAIAESDPKLNAELEATFPCYTCTEARRCYPEDGGYARVIDRVAVFSLHNFQSECVELFDLQFDDFADFLGGRGLDAWIEDVRRAPTSTTNAHLLNRLQHLRDCPLSFASDGYSDAAGMMEILLLKWELVTQVVDRVLKLRADVGRAHLSLTPRHVLVQLGPTGTAARAAWSFRVGLIGVADAVPVRVEDGVDAALTRPPASTDPFYGSAALHRASAEFERWRRVAVRLEEVTADPENPSITKVNGRLMDSSLVSSDLGPDSVFQIDLPAADSLHRLVVWGKPTEKPSGNEVAFTGALAGQKHAVDLSLCVGNLIEEVNCAHYPYLGVTHDLYALGVLGVRAMLVNGRQKLSEVLPQITRYVDASRKSGVSSAGEFSFSAPTVADTASWWDCGHVLFSPPERLPFTNPTLGAAWNRILTVVMRLLATNAPFGYAAVVAGRDDEFRVLSAIYDECLSIGEDLRGALYAALGRGERDPALSSLLANYVQDEPAVGESAAKS